MEDNYPKAYKEVIEILNFMPKESVDKLPQTMLDTFKTKMDKNYNFHVDINEDFENQNLLDETKAILANIFRDYWATSYQKEQIKEKEKHDRQKIEDEKKEKYNPDDIFKKKQTEIENEKIRQSENLPIKVKQYNFYQKIVNFFKRFFHID